MTFENLPDEYSLYRLINEGTCGVLAIVGTSFRSNAAGETAKCQYSPLDGLVCGRTVFGKSRAEGTVGAADELGRSVHPSTCMQMAVLAIKNP